MYPVKIESKIVVGDEVLMSHYRSAIARSLPTIHIQQKHAGEWCVVAGGPSLPGELKKIRRMKRKGAVIVAVNGTHDYLIDHGINPDIFIMVDPKESNRRFVKHPKRSVTYFIGASCHPSIFDSLEGQDVKVFYPINGIGETELIAATPVQIGGGSTVGLRAMNIGYVLGYRNIHLFGFDGCLKGEEHHAYSQPENDNKQVMDVHFQGKKFMCHVWMAHQADNFLQFMKLYSDSMNITVHTDGLIKHIGETICQLKHRASQPDSTCTQPLMETRP